MSTEIIILLITNIIAPVLTGIVTWVQTKKKYNAEIDSTVIQNMKTSLEFYFQLSEDQKDRLNELLEANRELRHQVETLQTQVFELGLKIGEYKQYTETRGKKKNGK